MFDLLLGVVLGVLLASAAVGAVAWWLARGRRARAMEVDVRSSVLRFREVGELVVFRMVSQQIVTAEQHPAGRFKEFLGWLLSSKKLALVVEYGIDFKYDLRDPALRIEHDQQGRVRVVLPPLSFQPHVRDIRFYDERNARWLPFLLGDIAGAFGPRFGEAEKNQLIASARGQAEALARANVGDLRAEVQGSARRTLEALALGFGARAVEIEFDEAHAPTLQAPATVPAELLLDSDARPRERTASP